MRGRQSWTEAALREQLRALPSIQYELGVFDGRMTRRVLRPRELVRSVGWLQSRNRAGSHVYLRPAGTKFVLVDDVNLGAVERMREDGIVPAAVVETSPANLQVWVRFPVAMQRDVSTGVGRVLADQYDGDRGSTDFRHLGRAVGFTNRKAKYRSADGRFPWVEIVDAAGVVTPNAAELQEAGAARLRQEEAERAARAHRVKARRHGVRSPAGFYARELVQMHHRFGADVDESRAEAAVAKKMAASGFGADEVAGAMLGCESIRLRKAGHVEDYVERTVAWAFGRKRRRPGRRTS